MGFTLDIIFVGLVAFVPQTSNDLTALLPDLTKEYSTSDGSHLPLHKPLLVYECANVPGGKCDPIVDQNIKAAFNLYETWNELDNIGLYGSRDLEGVEIKISPTKLPTGAKIDLSDVAELPGEAEQVDSRFLATSAAMPQAYRSFLAARLVLTSVGAGRKTRIGEVTPDKPSLFAFAPIKGMPDASDPGKGIADSVRVTTYIDADQVVIDLSSFRSPLSPPIQIKLQRKDPQSPTEIVTIRVMNLASCPIWTSQVVVKKCSEHADHQGSVHFEPYYEFSKTRPLLSDRPVPQLVKAGSTNLYDRPICPQGGMKP